MSKTNEKELRFLPALNGGVSARKVEMNGPPGGFGQSKSIMNYRHLSRYAAKEDGFALASF